MLKSLYIQNYALIEQLDISFEEGFSVITGETGAGKSILLGAIGLLMGQRADVKSIRQGAVKCVVEARFLLTSSGLQPFFERHDLEYEDECILRREISVSGKSRAFINDTPVSLLQMKEMGERLIDIHSQHQNLLLNKENFQLNVLDILAHDGEELSTYHHLYNEWRQTLHSLEQMEQEMKQGKMDEEYLRFQWNQLVAAHLKAGEQDDLEKESEILTHAGDIKTGLFRAQGAMECDEGCVLNLLKECRDILFDLKKVYPAAVELSERIENVYIELKDISHELSKCAEKVELDPARLEEVNERLSQIYSLEQKHRVTSVDELLAIEKTFADRLSSLTSLDEEVETLRMRAETLQGKLVQQAALLTEKRMAAAQEMEQQMVARLPLLGMPHACFRVEITARPLGEQGVDAVSFLFSANKNGVLQRISSVASGGEISRIMLSVKAMVASIMELPTIIFDEIDVGVSGEIADRMAGIMQEMAACKRQVISITHLPQIAARGQVHYRVFKKVGLTETNTYISRLSEEERIEEIAYMLSGTELTDAALNNARSLLGMNEMKR